MNTPKYLQVKEYVKEKIISGIWTANYMLPTEMELAKQFGVSRITVTTALRELVKDGMIYRVQGRGTFVAVKQETTATDVLHLASIASMIKSVESMKMPGEHRCLSIKRVHPSEYVQKQLNLAPEQVVIAIERVKYVGAKPTFFERHYLPAIKFVALTDEQLGDMHLSEMVKACGILLGKTVLATEAVLADAFLSAILQIKDNEPLLCTSFICNDQNEKPIAYIELYNTGKNMQLVLNSNFSLR